MKAFYQPFFLIVLQVFEDENEAVRYCDLLQGGGKGCEGVAEIEASSVRICSNIRVYVSQFTNKVLRPNKLFVLFAGI